MSLSGTLLSVHLRLPQVHRVRAPLAVPFRLLALCDSPRVTLLGEGVFQPHSLVCTPSLNATSQSPGPTGLTGGPGTRQ